jgi:hypothetical protein
MSIHWSLVKNTVNVTSIKPDTIEPIKDPQGRPSRYALVYLRKQGILGSNELKILSPQGRAS